MTLPEFNLKFQTMEACLEHLKAVRWKDGAYCPNCGSCDKIYHYSDSKRHRCSACKRVFRLITGTIFGDSPLKMLPKWFLAVYLETTHNKGISSVQLAKHIGVTQKTAWFMLQRIRNASGMGEKNPLSGDVEIDETYLGGKEKNKHKSKRLHAGRGTVGKGVAFGVVERGGEVRAFKVPSAKAADITPIVIRNVAVGSRIHADTASAYGPLESFYDMGRVNHSAAEYVRGQVHTNSTESLWALVKRVYIGTHHWWSTKHSQLYLNSACFRLNFTKSEKLNARRQVFFPSTTFIFPVLV